MAVHNNRPRTVGRKPRPRARGGTDRTTDRTTDRPVRQRLVDFFRPEDARGHWTDAVQPTTWQDEEQALNVADGVLPRFPLVRSGYDCAAVETHIADLERELAELDHELAELRAKVPGREELDSEIKRIGEQTSAVLIAANEQRGVILRGAQEEAERCVAEATAKARAITEEGEARLRELHAQHELAQREHDRLLDEVRAVSVALAALADPGAEASSAQPGD